LNSLTTLSHHEVVRTLNASKDIQTPSTVTSNEEPSYMKELQYAHSFSRNSHLHCMMVTLVPQSQMPMILKKIRLIFRLYLYYQNMNPPI